MNFGDYILYFVAGLFAANGIPHYVKGITGDKHRTPFGNPSTAVVNVIWGSVNFAVAIIILHYLAIDNHHVIREFLVFALALFLMSLFCASTFSKSKTHKA